MRGMTPPGVGARVRDAARRGGGGFCWIAWLVISLRTGEVRLAAMAQPQCTSLGGFFFQAEDGIRDDLVTGVQTCALPISAPRGNHTLDRLICDETVASGTMDDAIERMVSAWSSSGTVSAVGNRRALRIAEEIGRASCRERV